MKSINNE